MKFAFSSLTLYAPSLHALLATPREWRLVQTGTTCFLEGHGLPDDIAGAFSTLVLDWEVLLFPELVMEDLAPGTYEIGGTRALRLIVDGQSRPLPDGPVRVEVKAG